MAKEGKGDSECAPGGSEQPSPFPVSPFSIFPCLLRALLVGLVKLYQYTLGAVLPNSCRFTPTCSYYVIEAIRKHGAFKGGWLGIKRLARCHPYCKGGHDPVP